LIDSKPPWKTPLLRAEDSKDFSLDVTGASELRMEVHCPGASARAWAAWLDPQLK